MRYLKVGFGVADGKRPRLHLAPDLAAGLGINPEANSPFRLHFGRRSLLATVVPDKQLSPGSARITRRAARGLLLPPGPGPSLARTGGQHLRLGPLVGVLISNARLGGLRQNRKDSVRQRLARFSQELGGRLVFFATKGINSAHNRVVGYGLVKGRLTRLAAPLPGVIYDRCFGPRGRAEAHWLRKLARRKKIAVINWPVKLTKLATHRVLSTDPDLRAFVPFACPLNLKTLQSAIDRYPTLYLKPDSLSRGQGVFRLHRSGSMWVLERQGAKGAPSKRIIYKEAKTLLGKLRRRPPYLLQAGIDLATYLGNRYDFRILVQKDGTGTWQVTGAVARIAPETGVVTGPRSGGLVAPAERALIHSFGPKRGVALMAQLKEVCIKIAQRIESVRGRCVELGIDMGVTRAGELRVIEVNGRPLKVSLDRLNDPATNQRIFRYPVHFAASLDW